MRIEVTYNELSTFASAKTGKELKFSYMSPDTVRIALNFNFGLFSSNVGVKVKIEELNPRGALIRTEGNYAVKKIVRGAVSALRACNPDIDEAVTLKPDNRILILFGKIEKLRPVLANVEIHSLIFNESGATMEVALK